MKNLASPTRSVLALFVALATVAALPAQTFTHILDFTPSTGLAPGGTLLQATDGNLYGFTNTGGIDQCEAGCGTLYKIDSQGKLTTFHAFCSGEEFPCLHGMYPNSPLIQARDGNFYGTTSQGGANSSLVDCRYGCGTLYRITPAGELTTLYNFCSLPDCADGADPEGALLQAPNGNLYGETGNGGNTVDMGMGTLFELTVDGKLNTLHTFCQNYPDCFDGSYPTFGLIQGANGNFYGTTAEGGGIDTDQNAGYGTIFELTPSGKLTTLYAFCPQKGCADGEYPIGHLVQATGGTFYGATSQGGGTSGSWGTLFEITPAGHLTTLYAFQGADDGGFPSGITQATNGRFYGSTIFEGANGQGGTVFELKSGSVTTLYSFCSQPDCADGSEPLQLAQATNGKFYAPTAEGGEIFPICGDGCGTVFSLSDNLHPFVEAQPDYGKIGATIIILGNNLTGATVVRFHGTAATFQVVSESEITATVPAGATTGYVTVTTPSGVLTSNVPFRVIP